MLLIFTICVVVFTRVKDWESVNLSTLLFLSVYTRRNYNYTEFTSKRNDVYLEIHLMSPLAGATHSPESKYGGEIT